MTRSTYDIAASQIAAYVQPLTQGDLAMPFMLKDENGRALGLAEDHLSGKPLILIFLNEGSQELAPTLLRAFSSHQADISRFDAEVIAVSADSDAKANTNLKIQTGFPWPMPGDATGAVFASYGLHKGTGPACRIVVLTAFRQIRGWIDQVDDANETMRTIMSYLTVNDATDEASWSPPHAPVLLVPNVLSRAECGQLIQSYEQGGELTVRPPRPGEFNGDYKIPVYDHSRQDRIDHIIKQQETLAFLDQRLWSRVTPMIQKAFAFNVGRREDLHIARYIGARGGNTMGHRDNVTAGSASRRFALSVNLNEDYEGGDVVFKEFSNRGYRSPPGTALVFSSSLLHEVQETTEGTRYTLISHFH